MACSGLAYSTIKVYFSSIGKFHLSHSQQSAYNKALTPRLEQILRGIKREQASTRSVRIRLPITVDIIHSIYTILSKTPTQYQAIMLWAACCITIFGFLRVGEMTVLSQNGYDSSVHLFLGDITFNSRQTPTVVWFTIKQSKMDPFRRGIKLCLSITGSHICQIKALLPYLALTGKQHGPLFTMQDGSPLMRTSFKNLQSTTLKAAGLDDSQYNTHSFRIGAAIYVCKGSRHFRCAYTTSGSLEKLSIPRICKKTHPSPHEPLQTTGVNA